MVLREATRIVGVVPNAAYRHFADRDELLAEVCTAAMQVLADRMAAGVARVRGRRGDPAAAGRSVSDRRAEAKMKGYVGEACPECANFTLVRNGTCLKCDTCGSTTGCS